MKLHLQGVTFVMYEPNKKPPRAPNTGWSTKHHRNTMERAIPMNKELTIPTPPATFAEAENSIIFCITSLFDTLHEKDMSGLDREILIDQYVRILSTCLWHDVDRWRVEELLDTYEKMAAANEAGDPIGALELALELAAADRQILAYKTWAKK